MSIHKIFIRILLGLSVVVVLLQTSCLNDIFDIENVEVDADWNPDIAVPLMHARLSLLDFYTSEKLDSILDISPDNLITFDYRGKDITLNAGQLFQMYDQTRSFGSLNSGLSYPDSGFYNQTFHVSDTSEYNLSLKGDVEIARMDVKNGKLIVTFSSTFNRSGTLYLTLPDISQNGNPLVIAIPFDPDDGYPIDVNDSVDLADYSFDLKKDTSYNRMEVYTDLVFDADLNYIHWNESAEIKVSFKKMSHKYVEGYLGKHSLNADIDSMYIDLFKTVSTGKVHIVDPKFTLTVENSIGAPIRVREPVITGISPTGDTKELVSSMLTDIDISYPSISQVGQTIVDELELTKDNSNIADVVNVSPKYMTYDMPVSVNPDVVTHNNFITDSSKMVIKREMFFPFHGRSEAWDVDMVANMDLEDPDLLTYLQLNLLIENGLPVDVKIQAYLADSNENYLDSLFTGNHYLAYSGVIDSEGKVVEPTTSLTKVIVGQDRLSRLGDMKKVIVKASLSTTDGGSKNVKIFSEYVFDVKVGMRAKFDIDNE